MTPEQITALRAACFADPTAAAYFQAPGDANGLQAYLNGASGINVWRSDARVAKIIDAITWANYTPNDVVASGDTDPLLSRKIGWLLTVQTKQMNLQLMLQGRESLNCALPNVRAGLRDAVVQVPTGAGGANTSPGGSSGVNALNACVRVGTRAEIMLAAASKASDTTGSVTARVMTWEGEADEISVRRVVFKDNGDIWTP